ncbi:TetR/AcrR family transcriptional regulator [Aurantibacter sp.]|uniref:TetR/AcrR family transcriptional regulator n=1 Tax=Aurantibacter sp. TaxID=2807103 RepID=UPI003267295D
MSKLKVKEKILTAASELFYFDGYNQTGVNKILEKAQVSKDSMYRHFGSKEAIAVAYLEKKQKTLMIDLNEKLSSHKSGPEKVLGLFDYLIEWLGEVDYRGCGFQNIITDIPNDQDAIKEAVRNSKNEVHEFVYKQLKNSTQMKVTAKESSEEVMVLIEGALILSQIQKDTWPIVAAKKACVKVLEK